MSVSILIVNWNSNAYLRECLLSIRRNCGELSPQVVVVDGGSFDGCAEMISGEFPEAVFVQSETNVGFGRANNLGMSRVTGDAVWILNPDTVVRPGALQALLSELERRPDAALTSPRFLNADLTSQSSVHALPRPLRQAFDSEWLRRVLWPRGNWAPPMGYSPDDTVQVEAVPGAAMLMRSSTFRDIGGFTPAYFMYAEDMDLCFKVRRAGFAIYYVPAAEVIHHGGASTSVQGSVFSAVMMKEALYLYMRMNRGRISAWVYRCATAVAAAVRLVMLAAGLVVTGAARRASTRAAIGQWWAVLSWCCGGQRWARRFGRGDVSKSETPRLVS